MAMNLKKLVTISVQFPNCVSPRKKVVSGFCLGVVSFSIVVCLVFFNLSFKNPISNGYVSQGFSVGKNSSLVSWSFSFRTSSFLDSNSSSSRAIVVKNVTQEIKESENLVSESNGSNVDMGLKFLGHDGNGVDLGGTHLGNFTEDVKNGRFNGVNEKNVDFEDTLLRNLTEDVKNGSFNGVNVKNINFEDTLLSNFTEDVKYVSFERNIDLVGTHLRNLTVKNGSFNGVSEEVVDFEDTHLRKVKDDVKNAIFDGISGNFNEGEVRIGVKNGSFNGISEEGVDFEGTQLRKVKDDVKNAIFDGISGSSKEGEVKIGVENGKIDGNVHEKSNVTSSENLRNHTNSSGDCDIFNGRWVRDDTKPYYPAGSCPFVGRDFNCRVNKRPDDEFVKWKWQPFGCEIPSLNATDFLERLRGKKLVFVGDSLNRNMWESLVCILRQSLRYKRRVYEISGRTEFKKKGFYAFRFEDYNCSVDFVSSPFLVRESSFNGKNGSFETLRLDLMDRTTLMYHDADVLIFNTGHWWTHEKTSKGEDYYQEGNHVYPRLKVLDAYTRALSTWARWVDTNIDTRKTLVIFRGYSTTHFRGGQWNSGGQCHKETQPIFNTTHLTKYPSKMRAFDNVLKGMKTPIIYLNISRLTDYRKDGHPSIYRRTYKSIKEQIAAETSQDCSHWCLPGVPDTWNELLYASLLKVGRGSWKS